MVASADGFRTGGALSESLCSPVSDVLSEDALQDWRASPSRKKGRGGAKGALLRVLSTDPRRREKASAIGVEVLRLSWDSSSLESFGAVVEDGGEFRERYASAEEYAVRPFWESRLRYMTGLGSASAQYLWCTAAKTGAA